MQHLIELLHTPDSQLSWELRLGLCGLKAQLQEALVQAVSDPGYQTGQLLLQELESLLDNLEENSSWEELEPVSANLKQVSSKLKLICVELFMDSEVTSYIGHYQAQSERDSALWNEVQRLLLRLPERLAGTWRTRLLTRIATIDIEEDRRAVRQLPLDRSEFVYPGLKGAVKAQGLRFSDTARFDSRLNPIDSADSELAFLAGVVSIGLDFAAADPMLHHALKSIDRFTLRSLNEIQERERYERKLVELFHRVQATRKADPISALYAQLDLDEAIHSLIYLPPVDRFSWWGKLQQQARKTLNRAVDRVCQAGYQAEICPLWGLYADIHARSEDDLSLKVGGVPGEVSACLRVYAKVDQKVFPGRVLYRRSS